MCAKLALLKEVAAGQMEVIAAEIAELQAQAGQLEADIAELAGEACSGFDAVLFADGAY